MTTQKFKTDLNCASCVATLTPHLNGEKSIKRWSVDTANPDKVLTVEGEDVSSKTVVRLVADAGFHVLGEVRTSKEAENPHPDTDPKESLLATYYPLLLVIGYIVGVVGVLELKAGTFDGMRMMGRFMGGFFLVFSFFKLLDLRGFVNSYMTYDVLARRLPFYGWLYPFIELLLGVAFTLGLWPIVSNITTLAVMAIGSVGVAQALVQKRKIKCACLGSVLNLPMSYVTLVEDVLMAGMALATLVVFYLG